MHFHESAESKPMWFSKFVIPFIRVWGILTAAVLCWVGIDVQMNYHSNGIYLIAVSVTVFLLEIAYTFSHFLRRCVRKESRIINFCLLLKVKYWQKSVLYLPLSLVIALKSYRPWLSLLASAMLIILACFHILVCFRDHKKNVGKRTLLLNEEDYQERNDEGIFEILDNSVRSKEEISVEEPGGHDAGKQDDVVPLEGQFDIWNEYQVEESFSDQQDEDEYASENSFTCS